MTYDAKQSAFQITRPFIFYVYCVAIEQFHVYLEGFACATPCHKETIFSSSKVFCSKGCISYLHFYFVSIFYIVDVMS